MLHESVVKVCLIVGICIFSFQPRTVCAEYPTGAIPSESEIQDQFASGEVPPENLAEIRIVRFPDSCENRPGDWKTVEKSEQIAITGDAEIAKIVDVLKSPFIDEDYEYDMSPCPALGALVGELRNPKGAYVIVFFYAYNNYLMLETPSGASLKSPRAWLYMKEKHPELLRPTKGAEMTAKADAEDKNRKRIFYRDGSLRTEFPMTDGKYNGIAKSYFKNGNLSITLPFKNGELDGVAKSYFESGELLDEVLYIEGKMHGAQRTYDGKDNVLTTVWWWHGERVPEEEFKRLEAGGSPKAPEETESNSRVEPEHTQTEG